METLILSRLQFAVATVFHFLFVPLSLGLSILIAIMEAIYIKTGNEDYKRMAKFWGKLFLINFAVGVVTGLTLEFQFGTNWSRYSVFVGDVFGPLLAIEATVAFFLESTFLAVWFFGWKRLSPKIHNLAMWLVAFGVNMSAFWILAANAWMQNPVGYKIEDGKAVLTDFFAVITQEFAVLEFLHTVSAAYILSGFFVMGISAYHILKKKNADLFKRSFRIALVFALIFSVLVVVEGHYHGSQVAKIQPAKLAAMEAHWETKRQAPVNVFAIPDEKNEENLLEIIPIPGALSLLAYHSTDAEVKGLKDFPLEDRPPVLLTAVSFKLMVALGFLFVLLTIVGWFRRNRLESSRWYLWIMLFAIPLPYLACELGWIVAEVGRQPWIVNNVMRTSEAFSPIPSSRVAITLIAFIVVYSLLAVVDIFLLIRFARKGPEPVKAETIRRTKKKKGDG
jgi:cytochrome d ubiquinol oxidase subunit I